MLFAATLTTALAVLTATAQAQLAPGAKTGPLTSRSAKAAVKTCNILDYGAKADESTDIGPALNDAFAACKAGGNILIPVGNYAQSSYATFSSGNAFSIQLDGIIYRAGSNVPPSGALWTVTGANDFELFSSTSQGAIQGNGYLTHTGGSVSKLPNLLNVHDSKYFSIHDIIIVDAPQFHIFTDGISNAEIYNVIIVGGNSGGLDGIDVAGTNVYVHDVEVTNNKDECVTVKSPAHNILIENIYCNWSGGCALGSLAGGTSISNIHYNNIYTQQANQMLMIKSNKGDGSVSNSSFTNFIGHSNAYSLDINGYWTQRASNSGNGVTFEGLAFSNWKGTAANGAQRGPINIICPDGAPCYDITIEDFAIWTDSGSSEVYKCQSAWGKGGCLKSGDKPASYATVTQVISSPPSGYAAPRMANDLKQALPLTASIPIPTAIPTSFYPGATPSARLLGST